MSFHRFVVTFEVTVAAPGASNEPATTTPDQELITNLTSALTTAVVGKVKAKRQSKDYTVEKVKKA